MGYIGNAEIEASFRSMERTLDAMLEEARSGLERERIVVQDNSNRSGFDHVFSSFVWAFDFERRVAYGSEIKRTAARLYYREPSLGGEIQMMEVTSIAEIFQVGKQSRVREVRERAYPMGEFLNLRMDEVVMDCIAAAAQVLAKD